MTDTDKIILTDIDDVLWYFVEAWVDWLNKRHGLHKRVEDCNDWDINILYPTLSGEQLFEPLFLSSFWKSIEPRKDAQEVIPKLQQEGYTIKCCSATNFRHASSKLGYLLNYFPTIRDDDIILCDDKYLIKGKYLIDDKWQNLKERECPMLMTSWHNRAIKTDFPVIRVDNWEAVYDVIHNNDVNK